MESHGYLMKKRKLNPSKVGSCFHPFLPSLDLFSWLTKNICQFSYSQQKHVDEILHQTTWSLTTLKIYSYFFKPWHPFIAGLDLFHVVFLYHESPCFQPSALCEPLERPSQRKWHFPVRRTTFTDCFLQLNFDNTAHSDVK